MSHKEMPMFAALRINGFRLPPALQKPVVSGRSTAPVGKIRSNIKGIKWCGWRDLNPHALRRQNLNWAINE